LLNCNENDLFLHVQLLTYDGKIHPSKLIVPPETIVQGETIEDLIINNAYGINLATKTILYPLAAVKHEECQMQ
jgi:hypothetical protein